MIGHLTENSQLRGTLSGGGSSVEYEAGTGIDITDNVISNTITSYNDLEDKPNIPTQVSELENDAGYITNKYEEYSTNEIRVGTWVDGRPIYRKVYTEIRTPSISRSWYVVKDDTNITFDKILRIDGHMFDGAYHCLNITEGQYFFHTQVVWEDNKLKIKMIQNGWSNKECVVIIDYVKNE